MAGDTPAESSKTKVRESADASSSVNTNVPPTSKHTKKAEMHRPNTMRPLGAPEPYRAFGENEGDSYSSTSNSPARPEDYEESDFYAGNNDSQSSIGVPTFQDMSVTEDCEPEPAANRLPAEVLINIFSKLSESSDLLNCMCVSKLWARNCVEQLWHRPSCTTWENHASICKTLSEEKPYFEYRQFVKRLNLASLGPGVNDGSVLPLAVCDRIERMTLTKCNHLTDSGLTGLLTRSNKLLALDISDDVLITGDSMLTLAENCRLLQGLNVMGCTEISTESLITVAKNCRHLKRLKLNMCTQINDDAIMAFATRCPNILEIDLQNCRLIGNDPVTALLTKGRQLRELRLTGCDLIDDMAFFSLPPTQIFEHLRILDLTSCARLTDRSVEKIINVAPRLRNLVLAKCRNITDASVYAISKLGKNLHYVHLGHCGQITDTAIIKLASACNRIRYIDLGCCTHLTDASVVKLASLPKLRRIGLVKCLNITDESVYALAQAARNGRARGRPLVRCDDGDIFAGSSLERVHLSYCTNLTLKSIITLLNNCLRLTHLSLTGVQAFLRDDLEQFCRTAPSEFTEHQRAVFCVFSSDGVTGLRNHLNSLERQHNPSPEEGHRQRIEHDNTHVPTGVQPMAGIIPTANDAADADDDLDGVTDSPIGGGQQWG